MKDYLPIGSVVLLKNGVKTVMIYGRKQIAVKDGKEYDYIACLYPEGNLSDDFTYLFNIEDVDKVVFTGYQCDEEEAFKKVLNGEKN